MDWKVDGIWKCDAADGSPMVILPGLLCDAALFSYQSAAFKASTVGDFYGQARNIGEMADYALEEMPERAALLGHSMGARVALEVWRRAPDRIERLALADTGVHPVRPGEEAARRRLLDLARADGDRALVDAWLPPMIGPLRRADQALVDDLGAMCLRGGGNCYERQIKALLGRPDALAILPTIDCPTFVIAGSDDAWSPVDQHEAIAAAIPGAQLRVVPGAGHMAPIEDPERFNQILREWLSWPSRR